MSKITIREHQKTSEGFTAVVSIDGQTQYPVSVRDPFDGKQERDLEFYFEEWIQFPFDEQIRAQRAAASVRAYGERLFGEVFADPDAYSDYKLACREGLTNLQIEIEGESPDFQALHWEALKDPKQPRPFAVDAVFTRKRYQRGVMPIELQPSPVINLLVVTARPNEENDVGYRTISRPLIDAIEQGRLRVNVELLRPGTFKALSEHLERKAGFYHIVHFDAHGGLMSYAQFVAGAKNDRYLFQARYGRGDMTRYDGEKAFLFLEGESQGKADPVEAQELADLLTNQGVPICILNACQSGKQLRLRSAAGLGGEAAEKEAAEKEAAAGEVLPEARETSLGSRLMTSGVQMVVAMGYSVTVSAAALMMEKLYGELFAERGIPEAIRLGRKALYNDKNRRVYFNQVVDLEDWLLPVVYANRAVDLRLRAFTPQEEEAYYDGEDARYRFASSAYGATFGFVGRDLEILKIEKALLRHNVLLLQGMGGTGKTTLLNYLRDWWQRTGFATDVFYFGYDKKAHTLQQILHEIGKRVFDEYEFRQFCGMKLGAQRRKLAEKLKTQPYAIVLDNLESVTGEALAIQNTLPEAEREEIKRFLLALADGQTKGQTKVVLGSRSDEAWLQDVFTVEGKVNRYRLRGLDAEARTVLAEKILAATALGQREIENIRKEKDFERLMGLLAGYPLAMEVVLANLARQSAAEVLAGLDAADVNLDSGEADKTKSILTCVEYSHSNLSAAAQKLLLCLAPFKGFIFRPMLPNYVQELQKLEPFADWEFDQFEAAVDEAMRWGLLSPYFEGEDGRLLRIQPVFPYFLKAKLAAVDEAVRAGLATGFKNHYRGLAAQYDQMMESKEPEQRKLGVFFCGLEYENLFSALQTCLVRQESFSIYRCLDTYLNTSNNPAGRLQLGELIKQAKAEYSAEALQEQAGWEFVDAFLKLGNAYVKAQQYPLARATYQDGLNLLEAVTSVESAQKQSAVATLTHQLGIVAEELREYEQARAHFQQALDIKVEYGDRYSQASTYHQLGRVAQELREYEQARAHFQQALDIFVEYDDRYRQASTYCGLGVVAEELEDYEQARYHFQKSLSIFVEFKDDYSAEFALRGFARLYQTTEDDSLLTEVAQSLNATVEEVTQLFNQLNSDNAA